MRPRVPQIAAALLLLTQAAAAQPAANPIARLKSCSELDSAARTECVDALLEDLSRRDAAPPPSQPSWIVSETTSPVDYVPQVTAVLAPETAAEDGPSAFSIRCRAGRAQLLLSTHGSWPAIRADELRITYRLDDTPAVQQRWAASPSGSAAYFTGDVGRFLASLPATARLSLRVTHGRGTSREAVFHLQGLEDVKQKLAAACHWGTG